MASKKPRPSSGQSGDRKPERRSPAQLIADTRRVLGVVERGLSDLRDGGPVGFVPGLYNVAAFGRSVTFGLQKLRNIAPGFDAWYQGEVSADEPLLDFMKEARNAILHEASMPQTGVKMRLPAMSTGADGSIVGAFEGTPPDGASGQFFGDEVGGSGWIVAEPDGTETRYYAAFAHDFPAQIDTYLRDAPTTFRGSPLVDTTAVGVATAYYDWLVHMVDEAEKRFAWIR